MTEFALPAAGQVGGYYLGKAVGGERGAQVGEIAGLLTGGFGPNLASGMARTRLSALAESARAAEPTTARPRTVPRGAMGFAEEAKEPYTLPPADPVAVRRDIDAAVGEAFQNDGTVYGVDLQEAAAPVLLRARQTAQETWQPLKAIAEASGGSLHGEKNQLKEPGSLMRKIKLDMGDKELSAAEAAAEIGDAARYTVLLPTERYSDTVTSILGTLRDQGWQPVPGKIKNFWLVPPDKNPYLGINSQLVAPNGTIVEVQFHTPESIRAKDEVSHPLYERLRALSPVTQAAERAILEGEIERAWAPVPIPPGVDSIQEARIWAPNTTPTSSTPDGPPGFSALSMAPRNPSSRTGPGGTLSTSSSSGRTASQGTSTFPLSKPPSSPAGTLPSRSPSASTNPAIRAPVDLAGLTNLPPEQRTFALARRDEWLRATRATQRFADAVPATLGAATGTAAGAQAEADSPRERLRNMALGAVGGAALGRSGGRGVDALLRVPAVDRGFTKLAASHAVALQRNADLLNVL